MQQMTQQFVVMLMVIKGETIEDESTPIFDDDNQSDLVVLKVPFMEVAATTTLVGPPIFNNDNDKHHLPLDLLVLEMPPMEAAAKPIIEWPVSFILRGWTFLL